MEKSEKSEQTFKKKIDFTDLIANGIAFILQGIVGAGIYLWMFIIHALLPAIGIYIFVRVLFALFRLLP